MFFPNIYTSLKINNTNIGKVCTCMREYYIEVQTSIAVSHVPNTVCGTNTTKRNFSIFSAILTDLIKVNLWENTRSQWC